MQNIYLENGSIKSDVFVFSLLLTINLFIRMFWCVCDTCRLTEYTDGFIIPWYHYFPIRKRAYSDCYVFFDNGLRNLTVPITN